MLKNMWILFSYLVVALLATERRILWMKIDCGMCGDFDQAYSAVSRQYIRNKVLQIACNNIGC